MLYSIFSLKKAAREDAVKETKISLRQLALHSSFFPKVSSPHRRIA